MSTFNTNRVLGDFHQPKKPGLHPAESIGNQQVWDQGLQVAAIEYVPTQDSQLDLVLQTKSGYEVDL